MRTPAISKTGTQLGRSLEYLWKVSHEVWEALEDLVDDEQHGGPMRDRLVGTVWEILVLGGNGHSEVHLLGPGNSRTSRS
jgi:hypothetical protein